MIPFLVVCLVYAECVYPEFGPDFEFLLSVVTSLDLAYGFQKPIERLSLILNSFPSGVDSS
jgi:hypothetical protein